MASVTVHCPRCQSAQVYRNGDTTGSAAETATACFSSLTHTKSASPRSEMAFNGAGIRDTARTLKVGINTVAN